MECKSHEAAAPATAMDNIDAKMSLGQQCTSEKGPKKFGDRGAEATGKEIGQQHNRTCFLPRHVKELNAKERRKAQRMLGYLTEKSDKTIKGRAAFNGKPTREHLNKEETASPTASVESAFLT